MIGDVEQRLIHPFLLAALNIDPQFGDAGLAAGVFRASLLRGGGACRPILMLEGLSGAFIEPAIRFLTHHGAEFQTGRRLRSIETDTDRVSALRFNGAEFVLGPDEAVVLAVPPREAARIVPGLIVPSEYRSILNAHFVCEPPPLLPPITGVIGATTQWLFAYPGRLSVTVSDAGSLIGSDKAILAARIWQEVATITGLAPLLPKWRILHEREATFAATPAQNLRRPPAVTRWRNLALAGDWTATGFPATIEGAVRSGETAARALLKASGTKWLHGRFGKAVSKFRG
jgi:hydroxysqualene dehydroxylase